jgi:putative ABC transport system permease protein
MNFLLHLFSPWCWRMAWRDSRRARARLLMFSVSIMAGIAALVTIGSLRDSLLQALDNEARAMLGADVFVQGKKPLTEKAEEILRNLPNAQVQRETSFATMAMAVANQNVRLVQARAVEEGFPFFGKPVSDPHDAWSRCLAGEGFVLEPALAEHLTVRTGDMIRIGELDLPVLGLLTKPPPTVNLMSAFAPEMFFAKKLAPQTGIPPGSTFTNHRAWVLFPDGVNVDKIVNDSMKGQLRAEGASVESVSNRKRNITQVLERIYSFLSLIAFVALVLGGLGVASAIHVHAVERLPVVATMRCLGCSPGRAMAVYVIQGMWLGVAGAAGGVLLGYAAVKAAPFVLHEVLPVDIETHLSPSVAGQALIFGFVLCFSFALLPLLCVRRVPALAAVRAPVTGGIRLWRDPLAWFMLPLVAGSLLWLSRSLSPPDNPNLGPQFCGALLLGMLALIFGAWIIMLLARAVVRPWWPFTLRQGLAALYRPRNQTKLFLLSVGMGVALVLTTVLTQSMLAEFLNSRKIGMKENFFVIDLKPEQRETLASVLKAGGAEVVGEAPFATMTLSRVNGRAPNERRPRDPGNDSIRIPGWLFTQAYRVTWDPKNPPPADGEALKVSVEKNLARTLKVEINGRLTFTSGDHKLECIVTGLHEISWDRMLDNFPVMLTTQSPPAGITPSWAFGARVHDSGHGARMQREVSQALPGITILDITAITTVLADILERGGWLVHSLSLLTVITGLIIVVAVLLAGRRDRVEESVLLRTLGASRAQIRRILVCEYLLLGLFASLAGVALSILFTWPLATQLFHVPYNTWHWPLALALVIVCALTTALGMALSRGVASHPPLSILRGEG